MTSATLRVSMRRAASALLIVVFAQCLHAPIAGAQTAGKQINRLVVVFDPAKSGQTTSNFVESAARSDARSPLRTSLGNPSALRLLITKRLDESSLAGLDSESAEFRLQNGVVLEYPDEIAMRRAMIGKRFALNDNGNGEFDHVDLIGVALQRRLW